MGDFDVIELQNMAKRTSRSQFGEGECSLRGLYKFFFKKDILQERWTDCTTLAVKTMKVHKAIEKRKTTWFNNVVPDKDLPKIRCYPINTDEPVVYD